MELGEENLVDVPAVLELAGPLGMVETTCAYEALPRYGTYGHTLLRLDSEGLFSESGDRWRRVTRCHSPWRCRW